MNVEQTQNNVKILFVVFTKYIIKYFMTQLLFTYFIAFFFYNLHLLLIKHHSKSYIFT